MNRPDFLRILSGNGWYWKRNDDGGGDLSTYEMTLLSSMYDVTCRARIVDISSQLCVNGHYGVSWIEVIYEYDRPYSYVDLQDMITGIVLAEDNLLLIGCPFVPYYDFHGRNKANKKRRNDALRRKYNLDYWEKVDEE